MRVLFTRHGESEANVEGIISNRDLPHRLTVVGIAQAEALAERLGDFDVRMIFSSPILRARETAEYRGREAWIAFSSQRCPPGI